MTGGWTNQATVSCSASGHPRPKNESPRVPPTKKEKQYSSFFAVAIPLLNYCPVPGPALATLGVVGLAFHRELA